MTKVFISIFLLSTFSLADTAQWRRFEPWFALLETSLKSDNSKVVVGEFLSGEARVAAFNLEGLGRLYRDEGKVFGRLLADFRDLENALGKADYARDRLEEAKKTGNRSLIRKKNLELTEKKVELEELLLNSEWLPRRNGRLAKLKAELKSFDWPSYSKDRHRILKQIGRSLKSIEETDFDLSILEEGNGLHELRRELRWIVIEIRALNGMIQFRPSQDCPFNVKEKLLFDAVTEKGKYRELASGEMEVEPCLISKCLFLGLVDIQKQLGDIKTQAEAGSEKNGEAVSNSIRKRGESLYSALIEYNLLDELHDQLRDCRQ